MAYIYIYKTCSKQYCKRKDVWIDEIGRWCCKQLRLRWQEFPHGSSFAWLNGRKLLSEIRSELPSESVKQIQDGPRKESFGEFSKKFGNGSLLLTCRITCWSTSKRTPTISRSLTEPDQMGVIGWCEGSWQQHVVEETSVAVETTVGVHF